MDARPIRHRIVRTRNKHSRAILREGTIVIRLAKNLSPVEEREHIRDLLRRMTRHVLDERRKTIVHPFRHLLEGGQSSTVTLATGKKIRFFLEAGERTRIRHTRQGWKITVSPGLKRRGLHRLLWNILAEMEQPRIEALVRRINDETYGARVRTVKLSYASSQWGSCSPRGVIMINASLLFLPPRLLRYIIIHELAHRRRADHSPAFWNEVAWAMPHYERLREELHDFRLPSI